MAGEPGGAAPGRGAVRLVCSPIGNLADITYRAVETLRAADLVACEDTRHSRRLLQHYRIEPKELASLHEHNERDRARGIAERALRGEQIAVLSDAGTPAVSDPGYRLVNHCIEAGVRVEVLPGPSAVITALAGSGLPTDAFHSGGFLPVKSGKKRTALASALDRPETTIHFESPHRIAKTLAALAELAPDRPLCVARELTKRHETYHRGSAADLAEAFSQGTTKGEITLLIQGTGKKKRRAPDGNPKR